MELLKIKIYYLIFYAYLYIGLVYFIFPFSGNFSAYFSFLLDFGLIIVGFIFLNKNHNYKIRRLFFGYIVLSFYNFAINISNVTFFAFLNGLREFLLIFAAYLFTNSAFHSEYREIFYQKFRKFIKPFLIIQIPLTIYQFLIYGPTDWVGGTFGFGGTGNITITIFVLCFFLVWENYNKEHKDIFEFRYNLKIVPYLLPILFVESKITFIFIFIFFLFQLNLNKKALFANSMLIIAAIIVFQAYDHYVATDGTRQKIFKEDFLDKYLFDEYEVGDPDIARFTKMKLGIEIIREDILSFLFGKGIGLFKGGKVIQKSEFSKKYDWIIRGTRPYSFFLLLQGGIFITFIMIFFLFYPLGYFKKEKKLFEDKVLYLNNIRNFMAAIYICILLYNDALRNGAVIIIISFINMLISNYKTNGNFNINFQKI